MSPPKYKIVIDEKMGDCIIQTYYGSNIGWSFVKNVPTLQDALDWINSGIKIERITK